MSNEQWFLTEGNGSLTVRIREDLRVGEQSSGFLALDDPRRINQWFRFYFNEQGELWIACLQGFLIQSGGNTELRRLRLADDTKIKLLSNEVNICKDPFNINEHATVVTVKPYFNTYVAAQDDSAADDMATRPGQPASATGSLRGSAASLSAGQQTVAWGQPEADNKAAAHISASQSSVRQPSAADNTAFKDALGLEDTLRIPAGERGTAEGATIVRGNNAARSVAATTAEPDFYISSLWAEKAAGLSSARGIQPENLRDRAANRLSGKRHRKSWQPQFMYLAAGLVTGSVLSVLIIFFIFGDHQDVLTKDHVALTTEPSQEQSIGISTAASVPDSADQLAGRQTVTEIQSGVTAAAEPAGQGTDKAGKSIGGTGGDQPDAFAETTASVNGDIALRSDSELAGNEVSQSTMETNISADEALSGRQNSAKGGTSEVARSEVARSEVAGSGVNSPEGDSSKSNSPELANSVGEVSETGTGSMDDLLSAPENSPATVTEQSGPTAQGSAGDALAEAGGQEPEADDWRLIRARNSLQRGEIISPPGKNAVAYLQSYLEEYPESSYAVELLTQCADELTTMAEQLYKQGESFQARNTLEEVLVFEPGNKRANSLWIAWQGDS